MTEFISKFYFSSGKSWNICAHAMLLVALAFNDFFQYSGFAVKLDWSVTLCYLGWLLLVWYVFFMKEKSIHPIVVLLWGLFACHMFFYSMPLSEQLVTVTPLLTVYALTLILSLWKWTPERLRVGGILSLIYVLGMAVSLLPGRIFSGWNPNSSIILIPNLIFGLAAAFIFGSKKVIFVSLYIGLMILSVIGKLQNRSSVLCVLLFIACILLQVYKRRATFRIAYISLIAFNLLLPFLFSLLENSALYNFLTDLSLDLFRKQILLNGREILWPQVISLLLQQDNIFWGTGGERLVYSHNLSLDTLSCAGISGYCLFIVSIIFLLEKGFELQSKNNIFLYGFLALFLLNTFENVMICNNTYMIFQYMLLAIPISLKRKKENEADHLHTDIQ